MRRKVWLFSVIALLLIFLCAFSPGENLPPVEGDDIPATDYTDAENWAAIAQNLDKPVDVFLLYPTTYHGEASLADISDEGMRAGADFWLGISGSAFETAGNIFMPYYRQLNATWTLTQPTNAQIAYQRGAPKTDALAAFDYYLKNYNDGRPFIIASHSQGSTLAKEILFDYFVEKPEAAQRMVAAYVIGYSVTKEDFARNPEMRFAEAAEDTGVIISWNTISPDAAPLPGSVILPGALAINPIRWTRSEEPAPADANLGSFVDTGNGYEQIMGLADATLATIGDDSRVVICSTADPAIYGMPEALESVFGTGSFHGNDLSFYYYNIRENAENRVRAYIETNYNHST